MRTRAAASRQTVRQIVLAGALGLLLGPSVGLAQVNTPSATVPSPVARAWQQRLDKALDRWARWLSGYLYQIPGTDLYTMNPTLGGGNNPYRDVAGNTFAAAAAGYWLNRAKPDDATARPLRGLIKLTLGTHIAVKTVDRPDIQKWGATLSFADDWHADLFAVSMGMLLVDGLPSEQREQLRTILAFEADKQVEYGISKKWGSWPALYPESSHGEANAWSNTLLQMARLALSDSPRQEAWRNTAIDYSLNAICVPADMTSDKIIAGKPLKERVKGPNFEPGGIQEHHGFYHPGYEGWPLAYQALSYVMDQQLPEAQRNPDVYLHNWRWVFDRLKQGTLTNGRFIHAAGDDWITYGYGNTQFFLASLFAAVHFKDPDASLLADRWLALRELEQSLGDGGILNKRLATLQRQRMNDYSWYEGQEGCVLAQALWLLERMDTSSVPPPATEEQYNTRNVGTYHEPHAVLAWHRDPHRFASVSWRCAFGEWQAIVQPVGLPNLLKYNHNSIGLLDIAQATPAIKINSNNTGVFEQGGFWSMGSIGRASKRVIHGRPNNVVSPLVQQYQALVVLPEGPTVFVDLCRAEDQIWLLREGSLGMRLGADIFTDNRVRLTAGARETVFGQHAGRDTWHDLGGRSVTVEKLLTIHALGGEGTFQLLQKRQRPADRSEMLYPVDPFAAEESLLTHELYFGKPAYDRPRIVSPGEWFRNVVLVMYCDPAHTPPSPSGTVAGQFPCLAVELPDIKCTVAVNFADGEQTVDTAQGKLAVPAQSISVFR